MKLILPHKAVSLTIIADYVPLANWIVANGISMVIDQVLLSHSGKAGNTLLDGSLHWGFIHKHIQKSCINISLLNWIQFDWLSDFNNGQFYEAILQEYTVEMTEIGFKLIN